MDNRLKSVPSSAFALVFFHWRILIFSATNLLSIWKSITGRMFLQTNPAWNHATLAIGNNSERLEMGGPCWPLETETNGGTCEKGPSFVGSFCTVCNSSFFAVLFGSRPEKLVRDGLCWLLKFRQMGTLGVHFKGFLPWLVHLAQFVISLSLLSYLDLTQRD